MISSLAITVSRRSTGNGDDFLSNLLTDTLSDAGTRRKPWLSGPRATGGSAGPPAEALPAP